jgi:exodeoxyribonuclease VII large subunit
VLSASEAILDEATEYVGERRRTMIFAVRDRLRLEERHLRATRERLVLQSSHLLSAAQHMLASARQLLSAYDPVKRLAQGWAIVTNGDGRVVKQLDDLSPGDLVRVRLSDGSFESTVEKKDGETS